ncbi:MAG: DUF790 family protein [Anaerolineae bacterium]
MLTAELVRPRLHARGDKLTVTGIKEKDAYWLRTADELIRLFRQYVGQTRQAWEDALERYEGERTDYILVRGLAKVLEDDATFMPISTPLDPETLRANLFARGPVFARTDLFHPHSRAHVLQAVSDELGLAQEVMEAALFADRPAAYVMADVGQAWTPETLLARYNLELARGVLYWSDKMTVDVFDGYKDFWKYLKLFKLMFWATVIPDGGYHIELDGPISPFVKATTRYGRQFAAFLPALLLGEKWQMSASVRPPGHERTRNFELDHKSPLRSHFKRSGEFDSRMEADFAAEFEAKFGDERGKWKMTREDEVLLLGDTVMIPDFAFTHKQDGRRALVEIVGYWHPEYLQRKISKVREANRSDLILLVYEGVNLTEDRLINVPGEVLYFANKPVLKDVLAAVERAAR